MSLQAVRDNALYAYGYLQGRHFSFTTSGSQMFGLMISKVSSFISLPLPLLSFLALPLFGSTTTSINLVFFYLTWSALVLSHDPLHLELYGTLAIRLLFFLLPALGLLAFDLLLPSLSASIKSRGSAQLPSNLSKPKLLKVAAWATFNVLFSILLQAAIELLLTHVLHFRSAFRVSTSVPLPWTIAKDLLRAILLRGLLHYPIHRYILHGSRRGNSPLSRWHASWAHSLRFPFALAAAYDHPVTYQLVHWLPVYLPAALARVHVLTWHLLVALTSLETLALHSGYAVLPSQILLAGMARRCDAHYATGGKGNYGHWGVLDWACGTGCAGDESDLMEDVRDEVQKKDVRRRVSGALGHAEDGIEGARKKVLAGGRKGRDDDEEVIEEEESDEEREREQEVQREPQNGSPGAKRRKSQRKTKKAS